MTDDEEIIEDETSYLVIPVIKGDDLPNDDRYLNRYVSRNREEYRKRMNDQEYRNKLALKALDFIRASARILTEEIEKGYPVSEAVLDDLCEWHDFAVGIVGDSELRNLFDDKENLL